MSAAMLQLDADGRFQVIGPVVFATASELLTASHDLFRGARSLRIDLKDVTRVDSAALALLIEWQRLAGLGNQQIRFEHIPDDLQAIARLTGTDSILVIPAE